MLIERKSWVKYTPQEKEIMKTAVMYAPDDTPFPPEYTAAYLGVSPSTLQYWRSHCSDKILYSKDGKQVTYIKRHLKEYLENNMRINTAA